MIVPFFQFTRALDAGDLDFFSVFFYSVILKSRETYRPEVNTVVNTPMLSS